MTTHQIRRRLKEILPPKTFEPRPLRGVAALSILGLLIVMVVTLWQLRAPWYVLVPSAFVISQMWAFVTGVGHDNTHGAIFKTKILRTLLNWAGFAVYGFGLESWYSWHVRNHHAHTNMVGKDVDVVGVPGEGLASLTDLITIGSGRWLSALSLGYLFTLQGLSAIWITGGKYRYVPINRTRANLEVIGIWSVYFGLLWAMGFWYWLWLLVVPVVLANATIMSYVATQHFLRPVTQTNDPLANTMSVRVPWFLDCIHGYASYHREHHLFPSMSHASAPEVRRALVELGIETEPPLSLWHALKLVLFTPRLYSGSHVLQHRRGKRVDLTQLWSVAIAHEVALIEREPRRAIENGGSSH